jgi:hypothetical protein
MFKYLFKFQNGSTILVTANNRLQAVKTIANKYKKLFETENFEVIMIGIEMDQEGNLIFVDEESI